MAENPYVLESVTVGIMVWNPTNEDLDNMEYGGLSIGLKAGEKQLFPVACAKHLLNAFGQRGLTFLVYGEDEEKKGAEARERNLQFKKKQIIEYNVRNENRKAAGMGYLPPVKAIRDYALELGIKLLEPYSPHDEERSAISKTSKENEQLKAEMAELKSMLQTLMAQKSETKQEEKPEEKSELRVKKDGKWVKDAA